MQVLPGQIYKHYKKGTSYKVVALGKHSETLEDMVVYEALYENDLSKIWIRPLTMFTEPVTFEGKQVPRFSLIS
jgi:hypothetical protein